MSLLNIKASIQGSAVAATMALSMAVPSISSAAGDPLNILTVGANQGARAVETFVPTSPSPYGGFDSLGSTVTHLSGAGFNALTPAQLATYDVILTQWATSDAALDLTSTKVQEYVYNGGSLFLDGDYGNFNDLSWVGITGATTGCAGPWSFTAEADPILTDRVSTTPSLVNCHGYFPNYDPSVFKPLMTDRDGNVSALAGKYGAGRILATGPDHDFHARPSTEQYQVLLNELAWVGSAFVPNAVAGPDQTVDEGQPVMLDGTASSYDGDDAAIYSWVQIAGTPVTLSDSSVLDPTFTAPAVADGGETLTFELTVAGGGFDDSDTVSISIVNTNTAPVADAGDDASVAEGSPVTLDGTNSYDADGDALTYSWLQISGAPVTLSSTSTALTSFDAPFGSGGGAPGIVDVLVFELTVDDGFGESVSTVTIEVTNVNNPPVANAGTNQTINENSEVFLNGGLSSDPDGDLLTFSWTQIAGPAVALIDSNTDAPSFMAPFVNTGGEALVFELSVDDGYGGIDTSEVLVNVTNENDPPNASLAYPSAACIWPPNHGLELVSILGVADPDDNPTITIDSVTQDEPTNGLGDGDTGVDAIINDDGTVLLRAERSGKGDGRIYHVAFTASDIEGSDSGVVDVCVPHSRKSTAVDSESTYGSTE